MSKQTQLTDIHIADIVLEGQLELPHDALGLVLFAHGSGSSRRSPRNRFVADYLRDHGIGTLLFDLLTAEEERKDAETRELRFDIDLLAERLAGAANRVYQRDEVQGLKLGYFGSSTGAAAALTAAVRYPRKIDAIVSRGGRPDIALEKLSAVETPTLLIVGEQDEQVIKLNKRAFDQLGSEKRLDIVPNATHLFQEPGALEAVAELAVGWFQQHFA